jgi:hypothetical protein
MGKAIGDGEPPTVCLTKNVSPPGRICVIALPDTMIVTSP